MKIFSYVGGREWGPACYLCRQKTICGGVRRFSEEDLEWLGLVFCLKNTGMPIKKIREFVDLSRRGEQTLPQRCEILMAHKRDVEGRIASMKKQLAKVNQKIQCFSSQSKAFCVSGKIQRPLV
ncbi:MerR family transcriptional regulator [Caproiciproducens sp. R1]|uniref:MerR family transcriptional regulator n=1 Tax=Caproiciproducens sp. R1 TaxID=3435000 RepID=UPI0040349926